MGRTGRKRAGRFAVLLLEGVEELKYQRYDAGAATLKNSTRVGKGGLKVFEDPARIRSPKVQLQ